MRTTHYVHAWATPLDGQVVSFSRQARRLRVGKRLITNLTDEQLNTLSTARIFDDHEPVRALLAAHETGA